MPLARNPDTPPPMIGKIGRYTVFITPPVTPNPSQGHHRTTVDFTPDKVVKSSPSPMVQVPPMQFDKSASSKTGSDGASNVFGFFWDAVAKVQHAHTSLDEHLARWFGLNQSKYQWALDDYYETKGVEKEGKKIKEMSSKVQTV